MVTSLPGWPARRAPGAYLAMVILAAAGLSSGCSVIDTEPTVVTSLALPEAGRTLISTCNEFQLLVEPAQADLSCTDSQFMLSNLRWSDWGQAQATARGIGTIVDPCDPECISDGTDMITVPVTVVASRLADHVTKLDGQPLMRQYTEISVQVDGEVPQGVTASVAILLPVVINTGATAQPT